MANTIPAIPVSELPSSSDKTAMLRRELFELRSNKKGQIANTKSLDKDNQRNSARYELSIPSVFYPVLKTGEVEVQSAFPALLADGGSGGMRLWVDTELPSLGQQLLVGVEHSGGQLAWFGTKVVGSSKNVRGFAELNLSFSCRANDLLHQDLIVPQFDRNSMQYRLPASEAVLSSYSAVGATHRFSLDYVQVCPACNSIPTVRQGCSLCLSGHTEKQKMIHHFACAHVDFIDQFEFESDQKTELICRKCRCRNMIVGADFEYLEGPNRCMDCGQANLELQEVGHCLGCNNRFPMSTAHRLELTGYRVNRLDILDIIHTA